MDGAFFTVAQLGALSTMLVLLLRKRRVDDGVIDDPVAGSIAGPIAGSLDGDVGVADLGDVGHERETVPEYGRADGRPLAL